MTGGWPFFGKVLGDQVAGAQYVGDAIYEALLPHFNVLWSRRSSSERIALHTRNRNTLQFGALRDLVNRGLAVDQDDSIAPRGTLWAKYIDEQTIAEEVSVASQQGLLDVAKEKLRMVVEQIGNLVFEINQANQGIKQPEIFVATTQTWKIYQDLKKPALNADGFSIFSQAAYRLIFDSTTGERENRQRALERLPKSFRRDNRIVRVVDCIRHHSGGHLTDLSTFANNGMAISEVFSLYLKRVDAPLDEEYIDLQLAILEDLVSYLSDLKNSLRKRFQSQP
jgi:hypothetical protein